MDGRRRVYVGRQHVEAVVGRIDEELSGRDRSFGRDLLDHRR